MSEVCREFGISRKTGYKIFTRYKDQGIEALCDRSRRPVRYANQLPPQIENQIVTLKQEKPHWGRAMIRELLVRRLAGDLRIPAKSTIHAVLHRHGLVKGLRRPRHRAHGTPLSPGIAPNELWCADFKGEFKLGNGKYSLSVDRHRSRLTLPAALRGPGFNPGKTLPSPLSSSSSSSAAFPPPFAPTTACPSPVAPTLAVQSLQIIRLVVAPGHRHRAHPPRPAPQAERPS